jgi:hypothetical protein
MDIDWIHAPMDLNRSGCIPTEKVLEMLPYIVLKQDAITLGIICLACGMAIGIMGTYLWMRPDPKETDDGNP